jgi:hypothetical protein
MSSHHEWVEEIWAAHDAARPFAPENGNALRFKIGDPVIYTNPAGLLFKYRVTGFYQPDGMCAGYAQGKRYLVNSCSPWYPVAEADLTIDAETVANDRAWHNPNA